MAHKTAKFVLDLIKSYEQLDDKDNPNFHDGRKDKSTTKAALTAKFQGKNPDFLTISTQTLQNDLQLIDLLCESIITSDYKEDFNAFKELKVTSPFHSSNRSHKTQEKIASEVEEFNKNANPILINIAKHRSEYQNALREEGEAKVTTSQQKKESEEKVIEDSFHRSGVQYFFLTFYLFLPHHCISVG